MKKSLLSTLIALSIAFPAFAGTSIHHSKSRDIIVAMKNVDILSDPAHSEQGVITIHNPEINYKNQKGKDHPKTLTVEEFARLWDKKKTLNSFSRITPNAQLSFWDTREKRFYESKFSIEEVDSSDPAQLRMIVKFLDQNKPVQMMKSKAATKSAHPVFLGLKQVESHLNKHQTPGVLTVDNSPWDPTGE